MKFYLSSTASTVLYGNDSGFIKLYKDKLKDFDIKLEQEEYKGDKYPVCILNTNRLDDLKDIMKKINASSYNIWVEEFDDNSLYFNLDYTDGDEDELENNIINVFAKAEII